MAVLGVTALAGMAWAQAQPPMVGAPVPWGMGLQESGGPIKDAISSFNELVFWLMVAVTIFVAMLLAWCAWRYSAARNPVPSQNSHNTTLEIAWTVIPVLILLVIAIPSFRLIYYQDRARDADLTINVTGHQWYWSYQFPDHGNFSFDSRPLQDDEIRPGQLRGLEVDEPLLVPVGRTIRVMTNGADVIHSFFVPSLGVQRYSIPGRTLETWMRADRVGTFYGQCNQICGTNHWFMPIVVKAVPQEEFDAWVASARTRFARQDDAAPALADAANDTIRIAAARQ
ncbi:cytochrome c oxidase subunit II [Sediminicoccus sp. KRV36]|uniref:cytochrome c oxidase subunit II n=1 Tax=Sediminicoccus sp. KRV36 TaxID=3133721 RepID=UPI00200E9B8A|nr:cytochrome c oxidase subunit II [Sediminicoccus rosea]UPY37971.1 cytochrome c oxidase subunit II [Sediminicoccus rosea]